MATSRTKIEWTDATWSPVRGCSLVSAGCANCYAMKQAHRFSGAGQPYEGLTELGPQGPRWTGTIRLVPEALEAPLRWKGPRRCFVNSMSDMFHEEVPEEFIDKVFAVMALAVEHQFQILTKRPERMKEYVSNLQSSHLEAHLTWPLPNVWLGVSVENQGTADERIPLLLQTPAAVRWISAEPLLGQMNLGGWLKWWQRGGTVRPVERGLDWVVVGGESGHGARPCNVAWIRSIVQQCQSAGVPVFVKQIGSQPVVEEGSPDAQEWGAFAPGVALMDDCGEIHCRDRKGGNPAEWPADLRVREWPR